MQLHSSLTPASGCRSIISNLFILFIALLGIFTVGPLTAQSHDPIIDQARALLNGGKSDDAVELLEKAVAEKPNDAKRHFWLANAYGSSAENAGTFSVMSIAGKARDEFTKAVQLDPNDLEARFALMEFYLMAPGFMGGGSEKARPQAIEIRKRDAAMGHRAFALIASSSDDMSAARAEYAAAIRENPKSPKPHYWYALHLMLKEKNYKATGEELAASLRIDPSYLPAQFQIGHVAALSGANLPAGVEALRKYMAQKLGDDDPPLHRAHYWLGVIYEKQGKKSEARAEFQAALRARPAQKDAQAALKRVS